MPDTNTLRIRVLSDLHLERRPLALPDVPCDVIVLAGDIHLGPKGVIWAKLRFPNIPLVYVPGNHEYYHRSFGDLVAEMKAQAFGSQVHVLEREAVTLHGVTFIGCTLWTDFNLLDNRDAALKSCIKYESSRIRTAAGQSFLPKLAAKEHEDSVRWLEQTAASTTGPKVIISHHAPSQRSLTEHFLARPSAPMYASHLDKTIEICKPALWIHGHIHQAADYTVGQTRVICNPRGYEKDQHTGFNPQLVIEV